VHGSHTGYQPPSVADYGDLRGLTAAFHPLLGAGGSDLTFSDPEALGGGGVSSGTHVGGGGGGAATGGGGGSTGGGGGGGGQLPFTGLVVGVVAAVGSGLTAGGALLRRLVSRRAQH
jgi:alkaline phosphatase